MRTITTGEADLLRYLRPTVHRAVKSIMVSRDALVSACPHMDGKNAECPICELYHRLNNAALELENIPDLLDDFLLAGPDPRARRK